MRRSQLQKDNQDPVHFVHRCMSRERGGGVQASYAVRRSQLLKDIQDAAIGEGAGAALVWQVGRLRLSLS